MKKLAVAIAGLGFLTACSLLDSFKKRDVEPVAHVPATVIELSSSPQSIATSSSVSSRFKPTPVRPLKAKYIQASWKDLPDWKHQDMVSLWEAIRLNCKGLMRQPSGSRLVPARANPADWQGFCQQVSSFKPEKPTQILKFLEANLRPWKIDQSGLVTAYYEPMLSGALKADRTYRYPLYGTPDDLLVVNLTSLFPELTGKRVRAKLKDNRVVPYDTRAEFEARPHKPPVVVWLEDPIEAFFLQVQGSGKVKLADGRLLQVSYAEHNGHPYTSIGKVLIKRGELKAHQASMDGIKKWAKSHPKKVSEVLNQNASLVFFKGQVIDRDSHQGPTGSYGLPLIEKRAIAVDPDYTPLGSMVYLSTNYPASKRALNRLVFAQDTGTAIKGAGRVDYFWGTGDLAGQQAGSMKQKGQLWVLWPKGKTPNAR